MQVTKYSVHKTQNTITYTGEIDWTGETFIATAQGDGNAALFTICIKNGNEEKINLTVTGEWEVMGLLEILKLIAPQL